jgi:hypothetical protein
MTDATTVITTSATSLRTLASADLDRIGGPSTVVEPDLDCACPSGVTLVPASGIVNPMRVIGKIETAHFQAVREWAGQVSNLRPWD